ncbi:MAG: hypothetical protein AAFN07_12630 [Pseudomonadota bacterium]
MYVAQRSTQLAILLLAGSLAACGGDTKPASQDSVPDAAVASPTTDPVAQVVEDTIAEGVADVVSEWPSVPLIDPNAADEAVLAAIPGLNDDAVQALLAARPLETPSELDAVIGSLLTDEQRSAIYKVMFIPVDLNNGDLADYELIPSSLSPGKLAHEFEEYRPYETMEDFTREMSKYVGDDEVAYLTRFVKIN